MLLALKKLGAMVWAALSKGLRVKGLSVISALKSVNDLDLNPEACKKMNSANHLMNLESDCPHVM